MTKRNYRTALVCALLGGTVIAAKIVQKKHPNFILVPAQVITYARVKAKKVPATRYLKC